VRGFSEALRHELEGSSVSLTVVHPGGVRTGIAAKARRHGAAAFDVEAQAKTWDKLLRLSPAIAAEAIARAIERRDKRLLIGRDGKAGALFQRFFPVGYWSILKKLAP
jgi:short-subunit dehydrogenase